jgi:hypothetical protein
LRPCSEIRLTRAAAAMISPTPIAVMRKGLPQEANELDQTLE